MSLSRRQKPNARSSTESKLIGIDDAMLYIMWLLYFIKAQGYDVTHNQDNKSTILLATNGRMSSSEQTKHIHHRYFLVKDKVNRGELEIQHESTNKMWSDVLTRPKQGRPF